MHWPEGFVTAYTPGRSQSRPHTADRRAADQPKIESRIEIRMNGNVVHVVERGVLPAGAPRQLRAGSHGVTYTILLIVSRLAPRTADWARAHWRTSPHLVTSLTSLLTRILRPCAVILLMRHRIARNHEFTKHMQAPSNSRGERCMPKVHRTSYSRPSAK